MVANNHHAAPPTHLCSNSKERMFGLYAGTSLEKEESQRSNDGNGPPNKKRKIAAAPPGMRPRIRPQVKKQPAPRKKVVAPVNIDLDSIPQSINFSQAIAEIEDLYDPAVPCSYHDIKRAREQEQELIQKQALASLISRASARTRGDHHDIAASPAPYDPMHVDTGPSEPALVNNDDEDDDDDDIDGVPLEIAALNDVALMPPPPSKRKKTPSLAEKMMLQMGWKGKGHGIGAYEGIAEPLIAQTTGVAGQGVILGPRLVNKPLITMPETTVILLTNMVAPSEVDENLAPETIAECQRFGPECEIRETTGVAPEFAVQIFVRFHTKDGAFKALSDLDGRIFNGRNVRADPFDEDKFRRRDFSNGGVLVQ